MNINICTVQKKISVDLKARHGSFAQAMYDGVDTKNSKGCLLQY